MVHLTSRIFLALGVNLDILFTAVDFLVLARAAGEKD